MVAMAFYRSRWSDSTRTLDIWGQGLARILSPLGFHLGVIVIGLMRRWTKQLVMVIVGVHNGSLLVVDLLGFLVAHQKQNGSDEKDGGTPAHAIGPAKVPVGSVGGYRVGVVQFRVKEGRI